MGNIVWKGRSAGLFGKGKVLAVKATRPIRKGELLSMNFADGKPDNGVLLDYGVIDPVTPQVGCTMYMRMGCSGWAVADGL